MSQITSLIEGVFELVEQKVVTRFAASSPEVNALIHTLDNLKTALHQTMIFPATWTRKISLGSGKRPLVMWVAFLPPGQKVSDGIYVVLCFGKEGNGLVAGCAISNTLHKKYDYIKTVKRRKPVIDVSGKHQGTHYNNCFVNPLEVFKGKVDEAGLLAHLKQSVEKCKECLRASNEGGDVVPELSAALPAHAESVADDDDIVNVEKDASQMTITTKQEAVKIDNFVKMFSADVKKAGLRYAPDLISRFVCALLAKPFVVLTGLSGSGKTKLAEAFTKWIGVEGTVGIVPVGADWTNNEKLLGYPNALDAKNYVMPDTGVLSLLLKAKENPRLPFFLILDEMNLSHVERYFADFLSTMESTDGVIDLYDSGKRHDENGREIPAKFLFPANFFVIGTMNVDETTYMFSPKVLDRAQVIEFRVSAKEMADYLASPTSVELGALAGKGAKYAEAFLAEALKHGEKRPSNKGANGGKSPLLEIVEALNAFFQPLSELGAEFGYRSASEIMSFCGYYLETGATSNQAIDAAVVQKLLPKVHGSRRKLEPVLFALWDASLETSGSLALDSAVDATNSKTDIARICKYPLTAEKVLRMRKASLANGFASFAEA